ncbi:MAG: DUF6089 family protein, partial [Bacteroidota bacterium]
MRTFFSLAVVWMLLLLPLNNNQAQEFEIGVFGGVSLYSGDLSPDEFGLFFEDLNPAGGLYLRFRPTQRIAIRALGYFTQVSATDDRGNLTSGGIVEPLNFRSSITEFGATVELDLFYLGDKNGNHLAPYVLAGASIVSFNPESFRNGIWTEVQPLRTEGQGIGRDQYAAAPYSLSEAVVNVGGGLR